MELTGHVTEDVLIAYFCGDLGPERGRRLEQHVANCQPCAREYRVHKELFAGLVHMLAPADQPRNPRTIREALQSALQTNRIDYSILYPTNFVPTLLACSHKGLVCVMMGDFSGFEFVEKLKSRFPNQWIVESFDRTEPFRQQFEAYFARRSAEFEMPIDDTLITTDFRRQVLFALRDIPYGHFITYGELARRIGKPKASRAVGNALGNNPLPIVLPCHRVVAAEGNLGGFTGGIELKIKLLELEGATFSASSRQLDLFFT